MSLWITLGFLKRLEYSLFFLLYTHCFAFRYWLVWLNFKVWGKTGQKLYGPTTGNDYEDNQLRFSLFCQVLYWYPFDCKSSVHKYCSFYNTFGRKLFLCYQKRIKKNYYFAWDICFNLGGGGMGFNSCTSYIN